METSLQVRLVFKLAVCAAFVAGAVCFCKSVQAGEARTYVGSEKCGECHADEYESYKANAKKAHSFASIKRMKKFLSDKEFQSCCVCHTLGYGQPGGFRSETETPELKNLGCETCHGPGSLHVELGNGKNIDKDFSEAMCMACHTKDRSVAFRFRPSMFGGTHNK